MTSSGLRLQDLWDEKKISEGDDISFNWRGENFKGKIVVENGRCLLSYNDVREDSPHKFMCSVLLSHNIYAAKLQGRSYQSVFVHRDGKKTSLRNLRLSLADELLKGFPSAAIICNRGKAEVELTRPLTEEEDKAFRQAFAKLHLRPEIVSTSANYGNLCGGKSLLSSPSVYPSPNNGHLKGTVFLAVESHSTPTTTTSTSTTTSTCILVTCHHVVEDLVVATFEQLEAEVEQSDSECIMDDVGLLRCPSFNLENHFSSINPFDIDGDDTGDDTDESTPFAQDESFFIVGAHSGFVSNLLTYKGKGNVQLISKPTTTTEKRINSVTTEETETVTKRHYREVMMFDLQRREKKHMPIHGDSGSAIFYFRDGKPVPVAMFVGTKDSIYCCAIPLATVLERIAVTAETTVWW